MGSMDSGGSSDQLALEATRERMIEVDLLGRGVDQRLAEAMSRVPRQAFVPPELAGLAYQDSPLPIGLGQTISQPFIVARLCQLAKVRPGDKVLDVGTGSGYQAAVLAELGAEVHSIERIPALAEQARTTLASAGYGGVKVHLGDGSQGLKSEAPFRAIICAAAAPQVPRSYLEQLEPRGRAVLPVGERDLQRIVVVVKRDGRPLAFASLPVRFVPLIGVEGHALADDEHDEGQASPRLGPETP